MNGILIWSAFNSKEIWTFENRKKKNCYIVVVAYFTLVPKLILDRLLSCGTCRSHWFELLNWLHCCCSTYHNSHFFLSWSLIDHWAVGGAGCMYIHDGIIVWNVYEIPNYWCLIYFGGVLNFSPYDCCSLLLSTRVTTDLE
jgi:hypothetical protein